MPDGTVVLDDGREWQAVMNAGTGVIGARPKTEEDARAAASPAAMFDQYVGPPRAHPTEPVATVPDMSSLGLDQA